MTTGRINQVFTRVCPPLLHKGKDFNSAERISALPGPRGPRDLPFNSQARYLPHLLPNISIPTPCAILPSFRGRTCRTVRLSKTIGIPVHQAARANTSTTIGRLRRRTGWLALPVCTPGGPNQHSRPERRLIAFPTARVVRHVLQPATQSKSNSSRHMQRDSLSPHI